jgi:hypothetical protein
MGTDELLAILQRETGQGGTVRFSMAWTLLNARLGRALSRDEFRASAQALVARGDAVLHPGTPEERLSLAPARQSHGTIPLPNALPADLSRLSEKELMPFLGAWIAAIHAPSFNAPRAKVFDTSTGGAVNGIWSRPDFTVALLRRYRYATGRHLELVGYELKKAGAGKITAVHEALAHTRWVHASYLVLHAPPGDDAQDEIEALSGHCALHGIGFITFAEPDRHESFRIRRDPQSRVVDPARVDEYVAQRLAPGQQAELDAWMEG